MSAKKIVVIEDDREISNTVQTVLKSAGYDVSAATNGNDGRKLIMSSEPDLVLTDMMMPRMGDSRFWNSSTIWISDPKSS